MYLQRTIRQAVAVEGIGIHTGAPTKIIFRPAHAGTGVHFVRADLPGKPSIPVHSDNVQATNYATTLGSDIFSVSTVEHCLAAATVLRIDNLIVELEGPEIPIADGSGYAFWEALSGVGLVDQEQPRKYIFITEPIELEVGDKKATVSPYNGLRVTCTIDFPHAKIGRQTIDLDINSVSFERELAKARTFGFLKEVEALRAKGLAKGGSLDNAIVLDESEVMNPGGLRWPDEFVRHKAMDALGDLVTLGHPLMGHLTLHKVGHDMMNRFVRKLLESTSSYKLVELGGDFQDAQVLGRWAWSVNDN